MPSYARSAIIVSIAVVTLNLPNAVAAQPSATSNAPAVAVLQHLYDCRSITDAPARLACYDARVSALQTAESARDIRVVDREQMRQTRRGLFGLPLPNIGAIFGGDDNDDTTDADAVNELAASLRDITRNGLGRLVYTLDNGQIWVQTDGNAPSRDPRAGQPVVIRQGALGGFMMIVEGRAGVRVRRTR